MRRVINSLGGAATGAPARHGGRLHTVVKPACPTTSGAAHRLRTLVRPCLLCRSYRTLQEEEGDPEGGFVTGALSPVATGGGGGGAIGALAGGAAAGGGGGAVELATGTRSEFQRGITTPTKLQRTGSASADGEEAGGGAGGGTPREASPLRGASQMR